MIISPHHNYLKGKFMNTDIVKDQFISWLIEFVEKPNSQLNNWAPCPFARQARIKDKLEIVFTDAINIHETVNKCLPLLDEKDVIAILTDHTTISATDWSLWAKTLNQLLLPKNYVVLEDHPDDEEFVHGVKMNFGKCALMLLAKLDALNDASEQIRKQGYYNCWSQEELDQVVTWRFIAK